jgi:hypothetical protein
MSANAQKFFPTIGLENHTNVFECSEIFSTIDLEIFSTLDLEIFCKGSEIFSTIDLEIFSTLDLEIFSDYRSRKFLQRFRNFFHSWPRKFLQKVQKFFPTHNSEILTNVIRIHICICIYSRDADWGCPACGMLRIPCQDTINHAYMYTYMYA